MPSAYFISDVHLGLGTRDKERQKEERLVAFLDHIATDASHLIIAGDLFDAWIEYRTVIPKGFHRVITRLDDLARRGVEIHYLTGNHDFWMRDFFSSYLGIITHTGPFGITINGKRIYIHHGDGLAKNDTGYRILRTIIQHPFSIWLYSWLHPDIGVALARRSSKKSRGYTTKKDYGSNDGMVEFAGSMMRAGYDAVVMGHRHEPSLTTIDRGVYINLGDWISHNTYAVLNGSGIQLKEWVS